MAGLAPDSLIAYGEDETISEDFRRTSPGRRLSFRKPRTASRQRNSHTNSTESFDDAPTSPFGSTSSAMGGSFPILEESEMVLNVPGAPAMYRSQSSGSSPYGSSERLFGRRPSAGGNMFDVEEARMRIATLEDSLRKSEANNVALQEQVDSWRKRDLEHMELNDTLKEALDNANLNIQQVSEDLAVLDAKLSQAEKEKSDLRKRLERDSAIQASLADKENSLEAQVHKLRDQLNELEDELEQTKGQHDHEMTDNDNRHQAHVVVIKTLERDCNSYKKRIEELQNELEFERRRREAEGADDAAAGSSINKLNEIIEELRIENVELSDQNRMLLEEIESFRVLVTVRGRNNGIPGTTTPVPETPNTTTPPASPWDVVESELNARKERRLRNVPPRISSAAGLLASGGSGALGTELFKSEFKKYDEREIEKMKEENRALVTYIVSTLDSVTNLAAKGK